MIVTRRPLRLLSIDNVDPACIALGMVPLEPYVFSDYNRHDQTFASLKVRGIEV